MSNAASIRSINASAALILSPAMKCQIEVTSISACGLLRGLFVILGRQTLTSLGLDPRKHVADLFSRAAVESLLNFGPQCFQFGLAPLFTFFDKPQPFAHDFACRRIA